MKKSIIILSALAMTLASFKSIQHNGLTDAAAERMAQNVVTAFQHRSLQEYTTLFPPVNAFYEIMEKNSAFYGENLEEAKKEFGMQYTRDVLPALNQSFKSIISQGKKAGIEWSTIKLVSVDLGQEGSGAPATITFSSNGKEYRLKFERALFINGEWKVSQYLTLINLI